MFKTNIAPQNDYIFMMTFGFQFHTDTTLGVQILPWSTCIISRLYSLIAI